MLGSGRDPVGDIEGGIEKTALNRALYRGHFLLSSGLHSEYYFEKFRILEDPRLLRKFSEILAGKFKEFKIEWVVGPFTGGAILAFDIASFMGIFSAYAEKDGGKKGFEKGIRYKK
jgi:Orotate phosphoribosyltransferase